MKHCDLHHTNTMAESKADFMSCEAGFLIIGVFLFIDFQCLKTGCGYTVPTYVRKSAEVFWEKLYSHFMLWSWKIYKTHVSRTTISNKKLKYNRNQIWVSMKNVKVFSNADKGMVRSAISKPALIFFFSTVRVHTTKSTVKILAAKTHCKYFFKNCRTLPIL
jgi:hypothetical protein